MTIDLQRELEEIKSIQFDFPDQKREYQVQRATELSMEAVRKIAERMTELVEEEKLVEVNVASALLESAISSHFRMEALKARLKVRAGLDS